MDWKHLETDFHHQQTTDRRMPQKLQVCVGGTTIYGDSLEHTLLLLLLLLCVRVQ